MIAGHTKFSPDGFFGLIKLKMRKSEVQNLADLVQVIHNSTIGGYNKVQTMYENGTQKVFFYKWSEFLNKSFNRIPQILRYHHFELSSENFETVIVQTKITEEKVEITIKKKKNISSTNSSTFPTLLLPKGLSAERQWYLYEQIREHISDPDKKDEYCSRPSVPKP